MAVVVVVTFMTATAGAQVTPDGDVGHPVYPADAGWVGPMLWAVGGLFAAAAVAGPIVWLRARDTVPPAATHEEDPGADRH